MLLKNWCSIQARLSLWDNWGDERGCDEGHWHSDTRGLPWVLPEVVGTAQQAHCSRRRILQRGLEFHVCNINKSAHTKNVWKSYRMRLVYHRTQPTESLIVGFPLSFFFSYFLNTWSLHSLTSPFFLSFFLSFLSFLFFLSFLTGDLFIPCHQLFCLLICLFLSLNFKNLSRLFLLDKTSIFSH